MPEKSAKGITVEAVEPESAAERAGMRKGDVLLLVDGHRVKDAIDYMFFRQESGFEVALSRKGRKHVLFLSLEEGEDPGLVFRQFRVSTCRNNCIFCFVAQLPPGMRKSLYLKDEDYRMSFLYGNYITLTNLSAEDKRRIVTLRLSPLYISVHTTIRALRNRMLGNPRAPDVMKELRFLAENRIRMHAQIVLCPGYNDGAELRRTMLDLCSLYPYMESVAVVPVGLTAHRRDELRPVEKEDAEAAVEAVEAFRRRFRKKHGDPIVYGADELYIKAGRAFPPLEDYGDLSQMENGVGMVQIFMTRARRLRAPAPAPASPQRYLTFTGVSFHPYLRRFADRLMKGGVDIRAVPVENTFFGSSVTVTGLITGRDVIRALASEAKGRDTLLIPNVVLREEGDLFLDGVTVEEVGKALGMKTEVIESTPEGLIRRIQKR